MNTENFDALKRYESTEIDRRTLLHVPSGTLWSTSSDTHQVVEVIPTNSAWHGPHLTKHFISCYWLSGYFQVLKYVSWWLHNTYEWWIGCLESYATIFQSYMLRHRRHVQADWRSCTYGWAPNAIDISQVSLTCLSYTDTRPPFLLYGDSDTPPQLVTFYDTLGDPWGRCPPYPHACRKGD